MKPEPETLSERAKKLYSLIPADGTFVGNTFLRRRAGLEDAYWEVRKELIEQGLITFGRGRGGSVAQQLSATQTPVVEAEEEEALVEEEADLYDPLLQWLKTEWGESDERGDFFAVKITATPKGRPRSSGQWSRPDLTLVEVNNYQFVPQASLEVTTFEVKRFADAQNMSSVYETAAQSRWAHYAYLVAEVPKEDFQFSDRFIGEVERFNIGLMLMWRVGEQWRFAVEQEPNRLIPEPKELESLLSTFFIDDAKGAKQFKAFIGTR